MERVSGGRRASPLAGERAEHVARHRRRERRVVAGGVRAAVAEQRAARARREGRHGGEVRTFVSGVRLRSGSVARKTVGLVEAKHVHRDGGERGAVAGVGVEGGDGLERVVRRRRRRRVRVVERRLRFFVTKYGTRDRAVPQVGRAGEKRHDAACWVPRRVRGARLDPAPRAKPRPAPRRGGLGAVHALGAQKRQRRLQRGPERARASETTGSIIPDDSFRAKRTFPRLARGLFRLFS